MGSYPADKTEEILHPLELLARACRHIPDPYEPLSFMFGRYANRTRGLARKEESTDGEEQPQPPWSTFTPTSEHEPDTAYRRECRKRWAQLIQKLWLDDPLVCAKCGAAMRVISFVTDWPVIKKILDHLGLSTPEPPEPVAHSPAVEEFMHAN